MLNICFMVPPPLDGKPAAERIFGCNYGIYSQPNLFILYPATILKNAGHRVEVYDFVERGGSEREFLKSIEQDPFEIYVFYTVFLSRDTDIRARDLIREKNPRATFLFVGTEPTSEPDRFIDDRSIVIRGETEQTIREVVTVIETQTDLQEVRGISYLRKGVLVHNPQHELIHDLDELPFPDRSMLKVERYHNPKLSQTPFTTMVTSRGCSYRCYYCVPNSQSFSCEIEYKNMHHRKPPVRMRSAQNIIREFKLLREQGYRAVSIIDDQFVWGDQRTIDICRGIAPLNIEWSCLARLDRLRNESVIEAMSKAGCKYVDIGLESFNQQILDDIRKDIKVADIYRVVDMLKKHSIEPELNILIGASPLETKETIRETMSALKRLDVDYVLFSICTPFPHTEFNQVAREKGWMIEPEYRPIDPIKQSFISYPHLNKDDLEKIIREAYIGFYFRPSYMVRRLLRLKGFRDLKNKLKAAISILRK